MYGYMFLFIHFIIEGYVWCFQFLADTNNTYADMIPMILWKCYENFYICLWLHICVHFCWSRITITWENTFNLPDIAKQSTKSDYSNLHSYIKCLRISVAAHPCQYLVLPVFFISAWCVGSCILLCS